MLVHVCDTLGLPRLAPAWQGLRLRSTGHSHKATALLLARSAPRRWKFVLVADHGIPAGVLLFRHPQAGGRLLQVPQRRQGRPPDGALRRRPLQLPARRPPLRGRRSAAGAGQGAAPGRRVRPPLSRASFFVLPRHRGGGGGYDVHRVPGEAGGGGRGAAAGQLRARVPPRLHRPLDRPGPDDVPALPGPTAGPPPSGPARSPASSRAFGSEGIRIRTGPDQPTARIVRIKLLEGTSVNSPPRLPAALAGCAAAGSRQLGPRRWCRRARNTADRFASRTGPALSRFSFFLDNQSDACAYLAFFLC